MAKSSRLYFTKVVATSSGDAFLTAHVVDQGSDPTFTRFTKVGDDGWVHLGDLGAVVYAATSMPTPNSTRTSVLALGRDGPLRIYVPGQAPKDLSVPVKDKAAYLEAICAASDGVYVCGGQRQILRLADQKWDSVDQGLYAKFDGKSDCSLYAIVELMGGGLLTVGSNGFVAIRDANNAWQQIDAGTNVDLLCAVAAADGGAWVGGSDGTLLRMSPDRRSWLDLSNRALSTQSFDSLAVLNEVLFVTAFDRLLSLEPGQPLANASGPQTEGAEYHCVSVAGEFLWVTGDEHVNRFGPGGWTYFHCPDNV